MGQKFSSSQLQMSDREDIGAQNFIFVARVSLNHACKLRLTESRRGSVASWKWATRRNCPPSKFWAVEKLSKNFVFVGKFSSKNAKFRAETPNVGEINGQIGNSEHPYASPLSIWILQLHAVGKLQLIVPPTFLTHDAAGEAVGYFSSVFRTCTVRLKLK